MDSRSALVRRRSLAVLILLLEMVARNADSLRTGCNLMQGYLLHSPVADLAHVKLVVAAAVDGVDRAELLRQFARPAEFADDAAVQLQLVDLAVTVDILR